MSALGGVLLYMLLTILIAFVTVLFVVIEIGGPAWWLMHRLGRRGWADALALGAGLTFVLSLGIAASGGYLPTYLMTYSGYQALRDPAAHMVSGRLSWLWTIEAAALMAAIGAVVGLTVWRIAYRHVAEAATP